MGFDSLMFMNEMSPWNEMMLLDIMKRIDTVLTFWKTKTLPGGISATVGATQLEQLRKMLNQINGAFDTTIALTHGDSVVSGKGLMFAGLAPLSSASFLQMIHNHKAGSHQNFSENNKPEKISLAQNYPNPFKDRKSTRLNSSHRT